MDNHKLLIAIILGIVEGLTEFLPISSSSHLILLSHFLGFREETAATFNVVVQLGAILAVVVRFWHRFTPLIPLYPTTGKWDGVTWPRMVCAISPIALVGFFAYPYVKQYLFTPRTTVYGLICGGLFMLLAEWTKPRAKVQRLGEISTRQALMIGSLQCLALWPGFSRSGSTIAAGVMAGIRTTVAAEFSFLIAVPTVTGAGILELLKSRHLLSCDDFLLLIVGFSAAFITALLSLKFCLSLIERISLRWFAVYRLVPLTLILLFGLA